MKRTTVSADWQPAGVPAAGSTSYREAEPDGMNIACYQNHVPPFVEAELARLYENVFSSMSQFRVYGALDNPVNTYVVWKDHRIVTIFLFIRDRGRVQVLNEVIQVGAEDVRRFANYLFTAFEDIDTISFRAIRADTSDLPYPFQRFNYSEDLVVDLPPTAEEYHRRLGKNTRRNIKRYSEKLQRGFPSVQFSAAEKEAVSRQDVRDIVRLNHERMAGKNKLSAIDDEETDRIIRMVEECGLVGVMRIDGRVVAGAIAYRVGANFFLNVLAHDPVYDEYWLGILCCYQTMNECIARHGKDFHFLWGKYEYKYTLLAQQRDLDILHVYRSWPDMLLNADLVLQAAAKGGLRRLSLWLHETAHGHGVTSRWIVRLLNQVRMLKGT